MTTRWLIAFAGLALLAGCPDVEDADRDDYPANEGDCDDGNPAVHPDAPERVNDVDDDCDGVIDDGTVVVDDDGDGTSEREGDCDDEDPAVHPGATEQENMLDDDCNLLVDDRTDVFDDDRDGYSEHQGDCDDANPNLFPGRPEYRDGIDQDCDGLVDDNTDVFDDDIDGWSEDQGDCNDYNAGVHPTAAELEDGVDQDCDGTIDDGTAAHDDDGDSLSEHDGDCDDADPSVHPGAPEALWPSPAGDGIDNDCDGLIDEGTWSSDDDADGYTELDGDCDDHHADVYPAASEIDDNFRDDDCDGNIDEVPIVFSAAAADSLMPATETGPLTWTPSDFVYLPPGAASMWIRYVVRDGMTGGIREVVEAPSRPALPARDAFPAAPVDAYELPDGSVRWVIAPAAPPAGATYLGELHLVDRRPLAAPLAPGDMVERTYHGIDGDGHLMIGDGATLTVSGAAPPLVADEAIAYTTLEGNGEEVIEVPDHQAGDLIIFSNQEQMDTTEDDWSYDCVPESRPAGGISLRCTTAYDDSNGKTILIRRWRVSAPAQLRCVDAYGSTATSCALPPTITVANGDRWSAFVECPVGFTCILVASPLGEWTGGDNDEGWDIAIAPADPLRDAGAGAIADAEAASGGTLLSGYLANLRGHMIRIDVRGGNGGTYERFLVGQVLIPQSYPIAADVIQVRSLDQDGFVAERAACFPASTAAGAIIAPVLTTYNPHYEPGPSLLSRVGNVLEQAATAGEAAFDLVSNPSPTSAVGAIKGVIGLIEAIFDLGDPQEDDGPVTDLSVTANASDPTCVDVSTTMRHVEAGTPDIEHAVTLYTLYEQP